MPWSEAPQRPPRTVTPTFQRNRWIVIANSCLKHPQSTTAVTAKAQTSIDLEPSHHQHPLLVEPLILFTACKELRHCTLFRLLTCRNLVARKFLAVSGC